MHRSVRAFLARLSQRRKVIVILVTWFLATGSQWDLAQTYAWGRMIVRYSATMNVSQAVKRTFSGEMCGVCDAVNRARQQEQSSNVPTDTSKAKLVLICPPAPKFILSAPERTPWSPGDREPLNTGRPVPPTPPPRVA